MKQITPRQFFIFGTLLTISLFAANTFTNTGRAPEKITAYSIEGSVLDKINLDLVFDEYLRDKNDNSEKWMAFMAFLSTLFAIFFVYTGFKIDSTKEKVDEAEKRIAEAEKKINEEIVEYAFQLQYAMSFIIQKQHSNAIDALVVLRSEPFVLKDDRKINSCSFLLAHCYYEKGKFERNKEDLAFAVQYINEAIADPEHPFKKEIIAEFEKQDEAT